MKKRTQFCGLSLTDPPKDENLVRIAERCEDADGWIKVDPLKPPNSDDTFQFVCDGNVTTGWYNSTSKRFYSGAYQVYPTHYKPLSKPPKQ